MDSITIGIIGIIVLLILFFMRLPIGIALSLVGFLGFWWLRNWVGALALLDTIPYRVVSNYVLCTLPLFVLMGQLAYVAKLGDDLYDAMRIWFGRLPGGLAIATIGGCAGFAATSGSSMATSATMAMVALPQMKRYNYDPALSTGCLAAGGTLGVLIPPSMAFILYGIVTEESIGKLFLAGILPGVLLTTLFILVIAFQTLRDPSKALPGPATSFKAKVMCLKSTWAVLLLFILVIGGMYVGIFTSTEGAGIGAFTALIIGILKRKISFKIFFNCLLETGSISAFIFLIIIGSNIFSNFLTNSNIPNALAEYISGLDVSPYIILVAICFFYTILGTFMEIASGILLTLPVIYPIVLNLGFDSVWFGVIVVVLFEMGMITPPVGLNVFVIKGIAKDVPMYTIFWGIIPFILMMIFAIILLTIFPEIATFIPSVMSSK